ncbi:MAG: hypothetical protein IT320_06125 [Anaerolineae bacterium]|nr:hypothetical protein [Anaerolineae bacterium]
MDGSLLRWAVVIVMVAHGLGHVMGVMEAWTSVPMGFAERPWLFSDAVTIESALGRALSAVWLIAMVGFVVAGIGLATNQDWWPTLAVVAAIISLVAIVPWWGVMPTGSAIGAIVVDVVVLAALLPGWREQVLQALVG